MLTVDYDRLGVRPGERLLDLGCGAGRHAFEAYRRGARVVALDRDPEELADVAAILSAMDEKGEAGRDGAAAPARGDALSLPFADATFDRVIAAEVLEHIPDDRAAITELVRVLRPGGTMAVTVPRWLPERICWALSDDYHAPNVPGGHVRIYTQRHLADRLRDAGLRPVGSHGAHALHSPYWWLKCAVGVRDNDATLPRLYHRFLVWDITNPNRAVRRVEQLLNPIIGKSLVLYLEKPAAAVRPSEDDEVSRAA